MSDLNHTTRRYPRTLEAAFGPHTSREVQEPPEKPSVSTRVVEAVCWAIALALLAAILASPKWWPK